MAIFFGTRPERDFVRVPNAWARDPKLSPKAKAALLYLLSHQEGYSLTTAQMEAEYGSGKSALYAALKELVERGYLTRKRRRSVEDGRLGETDYWLADAPDSMDRESTSGKPHPGSDQRGHVVSAGQSTSRFSTPGESTSGKSNTKKTTEPEDQGSSEHQDHTISLGEPADQVPAEPTQEPKSRERDGVDFSKPEQRDEAIHYIRKLGYNDDQADFLADDVRRRCEVRTKAFWSIAYHNGTLEERCDEAVADYRERHQLKAA